MMTRRSLPLFLVAGLLAMLAASRTHAQPGQVPADFSDQLVVGPTLDRPVGMAFLPDGRLLFVELKSARIRMIVNGALAAVDPVCLVDSVEGGTTGADEEKGLLGIAVDPGWPARPHVYVVYDAPGQKVRLSRLSASGDLADGASGNLTIVPASRHDLIRDIPDVMPNHNGGALLFGNDGMLYVALADDANACTAQDTTSLRGVLVRLDVSGVPDGPGIADQTALVPPDNPRALDPNVNTRLMWSRGVRNPFRMDIDRATGHVFMADVGHDLKEEIDIADGPNINFGWPYYEGTAPKYLTGCPVPMAPGLRFPVFEYDRTGLLGTICIIGGVVHRPVACASCNWPAAYDGDYFFSDYYQGFLRRIQKTGGTWSFAPAVPGQPAPNDWGRGFEQVTQYATGPDGALWYARMSVGHSPGTGSIRRIVYTAPPVAVGDAHPGGVRFAPPAPSPTRGETRFSYTLPRAASVQLILYDAFGRRVRTIEPATSRAAGSHVAHWDGRDANGREVSAGVYIARLVVDGRSLERRLPIVR